MEGEGQVTDCDLDRVVERICVRYDDRERAPAYARELLSGGQMLLVDIRVRRVIAWKDDE